jgi:acyl-CoA synthetase (NDP forming)
MTDVLETAEIIPRVAKNTDKPLLCSFMGIVDVSEGIEHLEANGIPNYAFPEAAFMEICWASTKDKYEEWLRIAILSRRS